MSIDDEKFMNDRNTLLNEMAALQTKQPDNYFVLPSYQGHTPETCKRFYDPSDPVPMALPVGVTKPPTLHEQIARLRVDPAFRAQSLQQILDEESAEDADNFDDPYDRDHPPVTRANLNALEADVRQSKRQRKFSIRRGADDSIHISPSPSSSPGERKPE